MNRDDRMLAGARLLGLWMVVEGVLSVVETGATLLAQSSGPPGGVFSASTLPFVVGMVARFAIGLLLLFRSETIVDLLPRTRVAA